MSTTTIGSMTLGTAANLTGAAKLEFEDSAGTSVYFTAATLRTKMFAGGTGYTAADPLVAGTANFSGAVTVSSSFLVTGGNVNFSNFVGTALIIGGTTGVNVTNNANSANNIAITDAGVVTVRSTVITAASATGASGLRLPHGAAPSAPTNGDVWTTTAGLFVRINGATVGPLT